MNDDDLGTWLYKEPANRPPDLGYWIRYKIVQAYYQKSPDKHAAIKQILHIDNYKNFLKKSGYSKHLDDFNHPNKR